VRYSKKACDMKWKRDKDKNMRYNKKACEQNVAAGQGEQEK